MKLRIGWSLVFCLVTALVWSQTEMRLDTSRVSIGQPAQLTIEFTYRADVPASFPQWPELGDTLRGGIEILSRTAIDTVIADKALDPFVFKQRMVLKVTHWEQGFYPIVPFVFQTEAGPVESNALLLEVVMPEVDMESEIEDIKGVREDDISLWDLLVVYWYWPVGGLALVTAVVLLFLFAKKKKPTSAPIVAVPVVAAEDEALAKLNALLENKWWLNGMVKEHHSEVSEILRAYLEARFKFNALEQTTDEILRELKLRDIMADSMGDVAKILKLTDLVKFAKANPLVHENEEIVHTAMIVINRYRAEKP